MSDLCELSLPTCGTRTSRAISESHTKTCRPYEEKTDLFGAGQELLHVFEERLRTVDLVAREDFCADLLRVVDLEPLHEDLCERRGRKSGAVRPLEKRAEGRERCLY